VAAPASPPPVSPPPSGSGQVLTATQVGSVLVGGAGADTLTASQGSDTLTGGAGNDRFAFVKPPWSPVHVTDFAHGQDVLDLRGVFAGTGYAGSDPLADKYLILIPDGSGGTAVLFDRDGAAAGQQWGTYIIDLEHVSPATLGAGDWLIR
jgi:Ca2+-binding RTX toxin-like protein